MLETTTTGDQAARHDLSQNIDAPGINLTRSGPTRWSWLYALVFLLTGAIVAFNIFRPITVLPRITPAPGYAFVNELGELATSEDHRGKLTLYSFTYADCAEGCPQSAAQIARVRQELVDRFPSDVDLGLVTISVDPERDTPARLAQLKQSVGVTGDEAAIPWSLLSAESLRTRMAVGQGFSVYYAEPKMTQSQDGNPVRAITFDPRYILVDGWGIIRAEYRTAEPDPDLLERDVNLLVQEARNSNGLVKLGYEAAHLFACYPR